MEEKCNFGSEILLEKVRKYLESELVLLHDILKTKKLKGRSNNIAGMVGSLLNTGNAILLLLKDNHHYYNEGVMLARGFFERITNICYLLLCDNETFERCMKHTRFKQYDREKNNEKVAKDGDNIILRIRMERSNIENLKNDPLFKEAIEEFEKENKNKQNFPIPKIEKRLGFLAKQSNILNVGLFLAYQQAYYGDASEALHGSFYGSLFHVFSMGSGDNYKIEEETNKNATIILWQTGELFNQLIALLCEENEIDDYCEMSLHNSKVTLQKIKKSLNI